VKAELTLAAGTVTWRRDEDGIPLVALIHRPKYQDWSFPKGKLEEREHVIAAAYRETVEETGFDVRLGRDLGEISYETQFGVKTVRYWSAKFLNEVGTTNPVEVDEVKWLPIAIANDFLQRDLDRVVLQRFAEIDLDSHGLILLRHAKAVAREDWQGDDLDRPLSALGEAQAKRLISSLSPFGIREIHSSSAVRCYETISPIARALNLDYFFTDNLTEYIYEKSEARTYKYLDRVLENDYPTLVCGHNPILPNYLASKFSRQGFDIAQTELRPGDAWHLHHIGKEVVAVDHITSPTIA
jgi:phosphohistidine phosphatase SixA/ADP-ribose pyrophosphatase YjhB (NUDIX family)